MRPTGLLLIALVAPMAFGVGCSHPKDSDISAIYFSHKGPFADIRAMSLSETAAVRIAMSFVDGAPISDARLASYRSLMGSLGIRSIIARPDQGVIIFLVSSQGLVVGGSSKGIAFVPTAALKYFQIRSNLGALTHSDGDGEFLSPIEGDWYVFLERS